MPVLAVNKKRKSDTRLVNVEVLPESDKITTGQLVVKLFQSEPVSDKVQPRTLRAGPLRRRDADLRTAARADLRLRPRPTSATATRASRCCSARTPNDYNNRAVEFRLEERIPNTNQWRVYAKAMYTLKRSFTSDFDF